MVRRSKCRIFPGQSAKTDSSCHYEPQYHYESVNVEAQEQNPSSFLWWLRRLISLRNRYPAFGRGSTIFPASDNDKVLAFIRISSDEIILIAANMSRFVQHVNLDLSTWTGMVLREIMGGMIFPPIVPGRYGLSLGPHTFYWFRLEKKQLRGRPLCDTLEMTAGELATQELSAMEDLLSPALWQKINLRLPAFLEALPLQPVGCSVRAATIIDGFILPQRSPRVVYRPGRNAGDFIHSGRSGSCFISSRLGQTGSTAGQAPYC